MRIILSIFFSEYLLKSLHYAQFYSFFAYDFTISLHLQVNYQTLLAIYISSVQHTKTFLTFHNFAISVLVTSSKSLTFTPSSTVPEVGMSLFCYFSCLMFFVVVLFILTYLGSLFCSRFQYCTKV